MVIIMIILTKGALGGDHMVEVTGEGPGQSENVLVFLSRVSQLLNRPLQLQVDRLVCLTEPLVERLSGALVGGDGPVPDALQFLVDPGTRSRHGRAGARAGLLWEIQSASVISYHISRLRNSRSEIPHVVDIRTVTQLTRRPERLEGWSTALAETP